LAIATAVAVSSLLVMAAPPVGAATVLKSCTGICGAWHVLDSHKKAGAVCVIRNKRPHELIRITVRPPTMYGNYTGLTPVRWWFEIQRKQFIGPDNLWHTVFTSSNQSAYASNTTPASDGNGFSRGIWTDPNEGSTFEGFRVVIEMEWWHMGSPEGNLTLKYDSYKVVRLNGTHGFIDDNCRGSQSD